MSAPNTTTRRYPRTLAEAFPDERFFAIERHTRPMRTAERAAGWLLATALGSLLAIALVSWWSA